MVPKKTDKRIRLILAADELFYKKGVATTTLANIAELSEVPLGNVYYYFKSKEDILLAAIEYRKKVIEDNLALLNSFPEGIARLKGWLDQILNQAQAGEYCDPLGSLCQELGKKNGTPAAQAIAELMKEIIHWIQKQLEASIQPSERSYGLAAHFVAQIQGIHLLGLIFKDPNLIQAQCEIVDAWLKSL